MIEAAGVVRFAFAAVLLNHRTNRTFLSLTGLSKQFTASMRANDTTVLVIASPVPLLRMHLYILF
jgi:hypothetical protein